VVKKVGPAMAPEPGEQTDARLREIERALEALQAQTSELAKTLGALTPEVGRANQDDGGAAEQRLQAVEGYVRAMADDLSRLKRKKPRLFR
jgi:chromosome segregation ATPase